MKASPLRRVAALYDVHGNLPALEAALADAEEAGVDLFVLGGDLALGPMPREVVERVLALGDRALALRGNCDRLMVDAYDGRPLPTLPAAVHASITWAARQLDDSQRDYLAALPPTLTVEIESIGAVLFCHATPRSDEEIITRRTSVARLRTVLAGVTAPVMVCGHTHMQYERECDDVRVVNAGSVGMPYGEPGAHWLLADPRLELRRRPYDLARAAGRISRTDYPDAVLFAERHVLHPPSENEMLTAFAAAEP